MNANNKQEDFLAMVQAHKGIVYKIANAYCPGAEERKDLVQEIIIQLWKSFDNYNKQYKYSTWVYRIALNTAISLYRKESRRKNISAPLSDDILQLTDDTASDETAVQTGLLQKFIAQLKELDKALLLLYLEEKSHREIAEILGISVSNVATKMGRIKETLQQKFATIKN
jgi:RNA polymerase sigma-70 factor (ECF subfamily)